MSQRLTWVVIIICIECCCITGGEEKVSKTGEFGCYTDVCNNGQYCDTTETRCSPCPCKLCGQYQPVQCQRYCEALKVYESTGIPRLHQELSDGSNEASGIPFYQFAVNIAVLFIVSVILLLNIKDKLPRHGDKKTITGHSLSTHQKADFPEIKKQRSDNLSGPFISDKISGSSNSLGYSPRYAYKTPQLCQEELVTKGASIAVMETGDSNVTCSVEQGQEWPIWTLSGATEIRGDNIPRPDTENWSEETFVKNSLSVLD